MKRPTRRWYVDVRRTLIIHALVQHNEQVELLFKYSPFTTIDAVRAQFDSISGDCGTLVWLVGLHTDVQRQTLLSIKDSTDDITWRVVDSAATVDTNRLARAHINTRAVQTSRTPIVARVSCHTLLQATHENLCARCQGGRSSYSI